MLNFSSRYSVFLVMWTRLLRHMHNTSNRRGVKLLMDSEVIDGKLQSNFSDPFGVGPLDAVESISLSPHTLAQICKIRQILLENGEERSRYSILSPSFQNLGFVNAKPVVSIRQNTVGVGRVCTKDTIDVSISQKQKSSA